MTENDYYIAWGLYAFAALGCLLVWFRLTRWLWRWLREPLRVVAAVALFTPTVVDPAKEQFAPAIAITALDLIFKVAANAWRAVPDLAMYSVIALAVYAVFALIRWPLERSARARRAEQQADAERRAKLAEAEANELFAPAPLNPPSAPGRYDAEPRPQAGSPRRPTDGGSMRVEPRV
ncbi:MFS transporter [Pseudomonas sp. RIT-PI-S]|uniref:MFS transporter n=1 Tax=Pseudomonas sp. RIT-PI-S TaxID=3035295 RepID=UPI0021D89B1C|nr:MFS transporter [Pseudomonas sp. RIT-PI-S]